MTYAMRVEKEVEESPNFAVSWTKGCLSIISVLGIANNCSLERTMGVLLFFLRGSLLKILHQA